jgi:phosphoribosylaminoimidazolecarboxamide formyltransferase/IMP cyclohydrolase
MEMPIKSALISCYDKTGLEETIECLNELGVRLYATGGTADFIRSMDCMVEEIGDLTGFPAILGGRVKTLHPGIFGGILAQRNSEEHQNELLKHQIDTFDLVIVDPYPFAEALAKVHDNSEEKLMELIDIGGVSMLRAAAKNYRYVAPVPAAAFYRPLVRLLKSQNGRLTLVQRQFLAQKTFNVVSAYDSLIYRYFAQRPGLNDSPETELLRQAELPKWTLPASPIEGHALRYGENPHQFARFTGEFNALFDKLSGKAFSYNNLLDLDAGLRLLNEFYETTFLIVKHGNVCGAASDPCIERAWDKALAGDPVSAYGGVLLANAEIDPTTAQKIHDHFFEILYAPDFSPSALELLTSKPNRILLKGKHAPLENVKVRTALNGMLVQDEDMFVSDARHLKTATTRRPNAEEAEDLIFAEKIAKHLKSNAVAIAKNKQLVGAGPGQTSRVDSVILAVERARRHGFSLHGAALASDAFFPFPDGVQIAHQAGIELFLQPGGSIRDQEVVQYCESHGLCMVMTGTRHFRH